MPRPVNDLLAIIGFFPAGDKIMMAKNSNADFSIDATGVNSADLDTI